MISKKELLDELQVRLGSEATEQDAIGFAEYLYSAGWLPNDLSSLKEIPQKIWDEGLKVLSEVAKS